jgi:hypothetical protein
VVRVVEIWFHGSDQMTSWPSGWPLGAVAQHGTGSLPRYFSAPFFQDYLLVINLMTFSWSGQVFC